MNNIKFASIAIIACLSLSQTAFASDEQSLVVEPKQQLAQELGKQELEAVTQGYLLEQTVRTQSRRSPLFAHILDTMSKNATLAQDKQVLVVAKG